MPALNTDKFKKAKRKFSTTVDVAGIIAGATTLPLTSVTGLDTDTAITLVVSPGETTEEVITGVVSGSTLINCVRGKEGTTDQNHIGGDVVAMYFTETHWDDLIDGVLAQHTQTGTHGAITATSAVVSGALSAGSITVGGVSTVIPAGTINQYAGTSAPTGWLLADGTAVSRTTYAALFAVTSTTYGVGDGSTTFNLPDLKGRVPVGKNTGTFATLGGTGGAETHTLTTAQIPAHNHQTSLYPNIAAGGTAIGGQGGFVGDYTQNTGGGGSHNNLQPYITVNYIIKT